MRKGTWAVRWVFVLAGAAVLSSVAPGSVDADTRVVNCSLPNRKIQNALNLSQSRQLTIRVQGACTENIVITRDDVTLQGDPGATISPANAADRTIFINGAKKVRVVNLTVNGGAGAIVGSNGAVFDVLTSGTGECVVRGGTRFGVIASYGAQGTVNDCTVENVSGQGIVAANGATMVVTNSTVRANTAEGILAIRSSFVRVGQNKNGDATVMPVTVTGNGGTGISISENSSAAIVGGSSSTNGVLPNRPSGIFVGRGSSAQIGVGSSGLEEGVTLSGNTGYGIYVEGANVTVLDSTITGNGRRGIELNGGASGRIGIRNNSSAYLGNNIASNGTDGIGVFTGSSAIIGGNTIQDNGTDTTAPFRFGISISRSTATIVGGNTISGHWNAGVFVGSGSSARIGEPGYGLPVLNTISGNGQGGLSASNPGTLGGVFVFQGGTVELRGAVVENNVGQGIAAFEASVAEIREATVVRNNVAAAGITNLDFGFDAGHGMVAGLNSTMRLRDAGTTVSGNAAHGISLGAGSSVDVRNGGGPPNQVAVQSNAGFGLRCFAATHYSGDVRGVTGNTGNPMTAGLNGGNSDGTDTPGFGTGIGNIQGCSRF